MRQSLRVREVVSGETLMPEHRSELQDVAISLSNAVQNLLGQDCKEELLSLHSNVAPIFLQARVNSQGQDNNKGPGSNKLN